MNIKEINSQLIANVEFGHDIAKLKKIESPQALALLRYALKKEDPPKRLDEFNDSLPVWIHRVFPYVQFLIVNRETKETSALNCRLDWPQGLQPSAVEDQQVTMDISANLREIRIIF